MQSRNAEIRASFFEIIRVPLRQSLTCHITAHLSESSGRMKSNSNRLIACGIPYLNVFMVLNIHRLNSSRPVASYNHSNSGSIM